MRVLVPFLLGLLFGLGLILAGMANPAKVLAFLDLTAIPEDTWDPSLALVMAGAVVVALPGYRPCCAAHAPCSTWRSICRPRPGPTGP